MIRVLSIAGLALLAATSAYAGADKSAADGKPPPLTPTEQFSITVAPRADQILLAPHPEGLSTAQAQALSDFVGRWRDGGQGTVTVQSPSSGGAQADRSAMTIQQTLVDLGVGPDQIRMASYDAGTNAATPIAVGFDAYEATGPDCSGRWTSFTHSSKNLPNGSFGCATTANMAALIANPTDLIQPRPMDSTDAARRDVVLGKYRTGDVTSSAKDPQANGAVSDLGQ